MTEASKSNVEERLQAVERLAQIFLTERLVYLSFAAVSMTLLLASAGRTIYTGSAGVVDLTALFGSSGAIAFTGGRILQMWSQALRLIAGEEIGK